MTDANAELLNTLDYLTLNVPNSIEDNIATLAQSLAPKWRKKMAREGLSHYLGLYSFICIVGGNGGIPQERRADYETLLRSLKVHLDEMTKHHLDIPPVIKEEAARVGLRNNPAQ